MIFDGRTHRQEPEMKGEGSIEGLLASFSLFTIFKAQCIPVYLVRHSRTNVIHLKPLCFKYNSSHLAMTPVLNSYSRVTWFQSKHI